MKGLSNTYQWVYKQMKLIQLKLKNFRCYQEEAIVDINDITVFIGKNDSGKSSVLEALDIYFNEPRGLPDKDDYHISSGDSNIEITCIFNDLPEKLILDVNTSTTLKDEYLLNDTGNLEIKKIFPKSGKMEIYAVANHPQNETCNDLLLKKIKI